jgi:hypothetical protein
VEAKIQLQNCITVDESPVKKMVKNVERDITASLNQRLAVERKTVYVLLATSNIPGHHTE